jgi:[ribosomal protein S18]-alanine N-acetyltransferase
MEKNNIVITKMQFEDLQKIKQNLQSDYDDFWDLDVISEELKCESSIYVVAKSQDEIMGFAGIKVILDEAELMNIVTKKDSRNLGIATKMMERIIQICKENKVSKINLEVNVKNTIAIKLYKKYNFKEVGLRKKYYNNTDDALLFTLNLN